MKTVKRPLRVQLERIFISLGEAETYLDYEANVTEYMLHSVRHTARIRINVHFIHAKILKIEHWL